MTLKYFALASAVLLLSIVYHCNIKKPTSIVKHPRKRYDYVVVGAGTAGCVIASQLSEASNISVLLIEAGGHFNWLSTVPLAAPMMQGTSVDWSYKTEPQYYSSRGLINHQQSWPRGKGLGGSGQLNYLVHSFGLPEDYDNWPALWSYENLYPYFEQVAARMNLPGETAEGRLTEAFESLNASAFTGNVTIERSSNTIKRGARWSSYHAYLQNSMNRKNLHVVTNTLVAKILIDDDFVAHGLEVKYEGGSFARIEANSEILISAGAINTPQLMMISGIGPIEELEKHRIPIVKDLSQVGKNLFDHLNMPVYVNLDAPVSITLQKMQTVAEVIKYFVFETGLLATNGILGMARVGRGFLVLFGVASADEKLLKEIANFETDFRVRLGFYRTQTYRSLFPSANDTSHEGFIYLASCAQPKSRGNITLRSKNVLEAPRIEPVYLEDEEDVRCTRQAVDLALETLETDEFRSLGANVHVPDLEDCQQFGRDYRDPDYAECAIRTAGLTGHHPGGTCRMGENSRDSVVDDRLRVHGIKNLRIMDASVMPSPISGTPNSVVIAMAERAVDLILNRTRRSFTFL